MRRRLPIIAVLVVVIALVAALLVSQAARRRAGNILSGTIEAYEVRVASKVGARVIAVRVAEGQAVKSGDTLLLLGPTDYQNAWLAARAQAGAAEAGLSAALARSDLARLTFERMTRLHDAGNLAQQEFDRAQAEAKAAADALDAARTTVEAARAQAAIAGARLADCDILAPVSGTVSTLVFRVGETVAPGMVPVTIIDLDQTWLTVYLPERLLGRVRLGDSCRVRVDAYPGRSFPGVVSFIADEAEFTPKDIQTGEERINQVYRTKVTIPNQERILKPGMPADALLNLH